jgi:hypothetical protein
LRAYDRDCSIRFQHEALANKGAWNAARSVLRARYAKAVDGVVKAAH